MSCVTDNSTTGVRDVPALNDKHSDRPTFEAPWQSRAFALAVALADEEVEWADFQQRLVEEIDGSDTADADLEEAYYEHWLVALEHVLLEEGLVEGDEFVERVIEFESGDRTAHEFIEGDHGHEPHNDHDHPH